MSQTPGSQITGGGALIGGGRARKSPPLGPGATAFGVSAVVAMLGNTILACAERASAPVFRWMVSLTGHPWITQGLAVLLLFGVLGLVVRLTGLRLDGTRLAILVAGAAVIGGAGLVICTVLG